MTIRLEKTNGTTYANSRGVRLVIQSTVAVDTEAEALEAKRAFENVLAPRFTRDEAIAIVRDMLGRIDQPGQPGWRADPRHPAYIAGIRLALEALAAAGVFSDTCTRTRAGAPCPCMRDLLDAAGIR